MAVHTVVTELRTLADPTRLPGMARYGIAVDRALGVGIPDLRRLARRVGPDHTLALELWDTGIHEARILAGMLDEPPLVGGRQMEDWVLGFDSWDLCDQVCSNLFDRTALAFDKARAWSGRRAEFVKRAGFATMAAAAVHRKDVDDTVFRSFLAVIEVNVTDDRNYVRKAVNWALRQIGKRSRPLNRAAIAAAERIASVDDRTARWIAADALRELRSPAVAERLTRSAG